MHIQEEFEDWAHAIDPPACRQQRTPVIRANVGFLLKLQPSDVSCFGASQERLERANSIDQVFFSICVRRGLGILDYNYRP